MARQDTEVENARGGRLRPAHEVRLLISCLACEVMPIARRAMAQATGTGWSLRRLRERVLRAGARRCSKIPLSARRVD